MEDNKQANKMNLLGMTKQSNTIRLYHGSPNKIVHPTYGMGKDTHDYGRGFYLTPDIELAKEWAMCRDDTTTGWLHSYELDISNLSILDFEGLKQNRSLYWVTELLQHRVLGDSGANRVRRNQYKDFLTSNFAMHSENYDVIVGWRADDSYFRIVKYLLNDLLNVTLLEQALCLGQLGIQYCCRSESAFKQLTPVMEPHVVPQEYRKRYLNRDEAGRAAFDALIDSPENNNRATMVTMRDVLDAYEKNGGRL